MNKIVVTQEELNKILDVAIRVLPSLLKYQMPPGQRIALYGIPTGGEKVVNALLERQRADLFCKADDACRADIIIDDIVQIS